MLAREDATHAFIDGKYFRALDEEGQPATPERVCKPTDMRVLMYRHADGRFMSFFGDLHIQGIEGVHFYTRQKMTMTRWFASAEESHHDPIWKTK